MIRLRVRVSPTQSFLWDTEGRDVRIGRKPECDLTLSEEFGQTVSGFHARIEATKAGAWLTDLDSTNGSFLNGSRIRGRVGLTSGDTISLGQAGPRIEVLEATVEPAQSMHSPAPVLAGPDGLSTYAAPRSHSPPSSGTQALLAQLHQLHARSRLALVGVAAVCVLLAVVVAIVFMRPSPAESLVETPDSGVKDPQKATIPVESKTEKGRGKSTPPKAGSKPPKRPPLTQDEVVEKHRRRVVWIGVEAELPDGSRYRYPCCTGWLSSADQVILTADWAAYFQQGITAGDNRSAGTGARQSERCFVALSDQSDHVVYLKSFLTHPKYLGRKDAKGNSRHYNLGYATLEQPINSLIPAHVELPRELPEPGERVYALGYRITSEMGKTPIDPAAPPKLKCVAGRLDGAESVGSNVRHPRRTLSLTGATSALDGSLVITANGELLAFLVVFDDNAYGVLASAMGATGDSFEPR